LKQGVGGEGADIYFNTIDITGICIKQQVLATSALKLACP
jgi:hypothetical protein